MAFTKQHYTRIANILSKFNGKGIEELVGALVAIFKEDNPRFLISKFLETSGFAGNTRVKYEENISSTGGKTPFKKMVNEAFENFGMKLMPMLPIEQAIPKNLNEDLVGDIMAYEGGSLSDYKTLKLFSELMKSGKIKHLQGHYGRTAQALVQDGWLDSKGNITSKAKENELKETWDSKKYQQNQMLAKARATADPKDAYQQYLSQHRASKSQKPPMTYDEWYSQWKEKKDECSKVRESTRGRVDSRYDELLKQGKSHEEIKKILEKEFSFYKSPAFDFMMNKKKVNEAFENFGMKLMPLIPVGKITTLRHCGSAKRINEARSIGAITIKKLKAITMDMWKKDHNVGEDEILDSLPVEWWDIWEGADSEIRRVVYDTLMDLAHGYPIMDIELRESTESISEDNIKQKKLPKWKQYVFKTRSGVEYHIEPIKVGEYSIWIAKDVESGKVANDGNHPWIFKTEKEAIDTVEKKWR